VEPGEFLLRLNHALDESSQSLLQSISMDLMREACRQVVHGTLCSSPSSFGPAFLAEFESLKADYTAAGLPGRSLELIPVVEVVTRFSGNAGALYKRGLAVLENPNLDHKFMTDRLSEFLVDPLSDRTWSVDTFQRKVRGWGRLGTAVRKLSKRALKSIDLGKADGREIILLAIPEGLSVPAPYGSREIVLRGLLPKVKILTAYRDPKRSWKDQLSVRVGYRVFRGFNPRFDQVFFSNLVTGLSP